MNPSNSIVTLRVKLGSSWSVEIETPVFSTLEELHYLVQAAVDFDNDHLYEFYVARTYRTRNRTVCDESARVCDLLPLPPRCHLFYLFDFGDSWLFQIDKTRKKIFEPAAGVKYPRITKETGEKPIQYERYDD